MEKGVVIPSSPFRICLTWHMVPPHPPTHFLLSFGVPLGGRLCANLFLFLSIAILTPARTSFFFLFYFVLTVFSVLDRNTSTLFGLFDEPPLSSVLHPLLSFTWLPMKETNECRRTGIMWSPLWCFCFITPFGCNSAVVKQFIFQLLR